MISPTTLKSCPQEEITFICTASNSGIVEILWIVDFMARSSVVVGNPDGFISGITDTVGDSRLQMDSLGHVYTITSLSTSPTLISTLETTAAPHLNGSTVQCRESTIAGFTSQSTVILVQVTGNQALIQKYSMGGG